MRPVARAWGAALLLLPAAWCQAFPRIEAETLAGKELTFPDTGAGNSAVVVMGFTHASQSQTMAWGRRLWSEYPAGAPVSVWSIAVLQDVPRLVRGMVSHGIRGGVPKEHYDRYLLTYRAEAELKQAAGFEQPGDACILLLDAAGNVRWRYHEPPTDAAAARLKAAM